MPPHQQPFLNLTPATARRRPGRRTAMARTCWRGARTLLSAFSFFAAPAFRTSSLFGRGHAEQALPQGSGVLLAVKRRVQHGDDVEEQVLRPALQARQILPRIVRQVRLRAAGLRKSVSCRVESLNHVIWCLASLIPANHVGINNSSILRTGLSTLMSLSFSFSSIVNAAAPNSRLRISVGW